MNLYQLIKISLLLPVEVYPAPLTDVIGLTISPLRREARELRIALAVGIRFGACCAAVTNRVGSIGC